MSSYTNLKQAIEAFETDSSVDNEKKVDEAFQKIVVENQSDLIKSLSLIEDFLVKTLNGQKSTNLPGLKKLKDVA